MIYKEWVLQLLPDFCKIFASVTTIFHLPQVTMVFAGATTSYPKLDMNTILYFSQPPELLPKLSYFLLITSWLNSHSHFFHQAMNTSSAPPSHLICTPPALPPHLPQSAWLLKAGINEIGNCIDGPSDEPSEWAT